MKKRQHDKVLQKIGQAIIKGKYKPLENLPHETTLCKDLKIGRNTLREAFKVLSEKGLINAAPKKGTWVTAQEEWDLFDSDIILWAMHTPLKKRILLDLSEARMLIEPASAKLAAINSRVSDLAKIEDAYERMVGADPENDAALQADLDFHSAVFQASHNKLWIKFGDILKNGLIHTFRASSIDGKYTESLKTHKQVMDAIRMKDPKKAEQSMMVIVRDAQDTLAIVLQDTK